jgi:signal peptidase I
MEEQIHPYESVIIVKQDASVDIQKNLFDVVSFFEKRSGRYLIKRVFLKQNDTYKYNFGQPTINGKEINAKFVEKNKWIQNAYTPKSIQLSVNNTKDLWPTVDITLEKDSIYVLGDHRDKSRDSRYFGPIKLNQLSGKLCWHKNFHNF